MSTESSVIPCWNPKKVHLIMLAFKRSKNWWQWFCKSKLGLMLRINLIMIGNFSDGFTFEAFNAKLIWVGLQIQLNGSIVARSFILNPNCLRKCKIKDYFMNSTRNLEWRCIWRVRVPVYVYDSTHAFTYTANDSNVAQCGTFFCLPLSLLATLLIFLLLIGQDASEEPSHPELERNWWVGPLCLTDKVGAVK